MKIEKFEDIIAWQKAKELSIEIYRNLNKCSDFSFKSQIQRSSVSIMNNISEGFERQTNKEFINFLYIAKGSSDEVRSMLYLGLELKYISQEDYKRIYELTLNISGLYLVLLKNFRTLEH